jgi:integrase
VSTSTPPGYQPSAFMTCGTATRASLITSLASGVPITVVSRRLGHAAISITLDVYGHCLPADDEAAAAIVAAAILGGPTR